MKTQATGLFPFVPSGPDFALALRFFAALGFSEKWKNGDCAGLAFGGASFILQEYNSPEWAQNQMVVYEVTDLDAYWQEVAGLNLPDAFPGVRLNAPKEFPWGRELHIIDPAGVCWHVRQTP